MHNFIAAYENQGNVVVKKENSKSDIAVKIKGNFCRGINKEEEEEKKEEKPKGYYARVKEWVSSKFGKKDDHGKKDDDKKVEEADKKDPAEKDGEKKESDGPSEDAKANPDKKDEDKKDDDKNEDDKKKDEKKKNNLEDMLTLKDLDVEIKKGEFVCIIGETGCGKTSLLLSMLGDLLYIPQSEIDIVGGDMERMLTKEELKAMTHSVQHLDIDPEDAPIKLEGSLSYVEQQAWIQNMTLRDNILFGEEFNKKKYVEAMLAC